MISRPRQRVARVEHHEGATHEPRCALRNDLTPGNQAGLPWDQTMTARDWEMISVPAGQFRALRFANLINFRSTDFSRAACQRQETIWFAPEVGRWVARESSGIYYINDSSVDTPYNEPGYRWELLEWT